MSSGFVNIKPASKTSGPKYWRSLDHAASTPEFQEWVHREFPAAESDLMDGNSRRTILKLMAASFGMAGLTACSRPEQRLAPQARGQEDYVPGSPYYYASTVVLSGQPTGVIVKTFDGRPTKIEGNPDHPSSMGAATALMQASVLELYDADRSKSVLSGTTASTWDAFGKALSGISMGDGSGLRILSEATVSPTLDSLRNQLFAKYPGARWVEYDAVSRENERAGTMLAFGQPLSVHPQYDKAKVILSLDHDFLGLDNATPLATKLFSKRRRVENEEDLGELSRLYAVESQFSLTGANAEHRLRARGSEIRAFAQDLLGALSAAPAAGNDRRSKFLSVVSADLKGAGKEALVVVGPRQPAAVHALVHQINQALGANGSTVNFIPAPRSEKVSNGVEALTALVGEINSGKVTTLLILGGNPVYTAPVDLQFAATLAKVSNSIHLGSHVDETAASAKWHLPEAHYLETWGDTRTASGISAIQQPMIQPLYGGKSAIEVIAQVLALPEQGGHQIVKAFWTSQWPAAGAENTWRKALNDGVIAGVATATVAPAAKVGALDPAPAAASGIEVAFVPSSATWDGRFTNNAWMQEMPDPITKLVWDNAAMISPAMAKAQKLVNGDMVSLSQGSVKLELPVMIQPGHADNAVTITLGYGRTHAGKIGNEVGFNANLLRTSTAFWYGQGFAMSATGAKHVQATTQEHGSMREPENLGGNLRPVVRELTIEEFKKEPKAIKEMVEVPELVSLHPVAEGVDYTKGYQWGMAIDLGSCTGCNACVVACQAENNIPVVGKEQVLMGREMHWIRVDRYYVGDEDEPRAVEQPLPCMQCENAPCEYVCPVAATTHSPEGLNDMAYNRCVGTRYCANNCPYKVRHFNFLNFHLNEPEITAMVQNPDVTVRMRGIMEKCTYCVQRIQNARITAHADGRRSIAESEVVTACQQTCPAEAITFGNINDPNSRVSKLKKQERNYGLLEELNTKPRTTYLGRLRNVNPALESPEEKV